ncbi:MULTISPECIES: BREX-2 system phosphatase PglZ [unclassified Streptomyces]|uniref:BREX-2 system phosphatase PglZ n=1 Tax=unclassified Streptomyces TaxID=2593676 RepID=UPI002E2C0846|nr:BREX-2 system phosphatase PglZ [Streptomyces sp. NBC_00228]
MGVLVPELDQRIIAGLLASQLARTKGRRLLLVHGKYAAKGPKEFSVPVGDGTRRKVRVTHATSVLGLTDAWQAHLAAEDADLLVVTTDVPEGRISHDLLGEMVRPQIVTVNEADIVKQLFGAADLDPRMRRDPWLWLPPALIDAEPDAAQGGWPQHGTVLTLDAAMRALVGVRLGLEGLLEGGASVDVDALLAWSRTPGDPDRLAALSEAERRGISEWLAQNAGEAAPVLLRLALQGRGAEATALGVLASVMTGDTASADAAVALGSVFGSGSRPSELRAYARAVEGTLTRWIGEASGRGPQSEEARQRVVDVLYQADRLADEAHLTAALAGNPFLPSGFQTRLHELADALHEGPQAAQSAWEHVSEHQLAVVLYPKRVELARMAVRLLRWLNTPEPAVISVGWAVCAHVADWGWVDRALAQLWVGDDEAEPALAQAYRTVHDAARQRRALLDEAFAAQLGPWVQRTSPAQPEGALPVEDVLRTIALPLAKVRPPLVLVLDGMSSAVAAQLGEELTGAGRWSELSGDGRRAAAVAMIPSVTVISRATLLCGRPVSGGEDEEKQGFAAFWKQHRHPAVLFHKSDIPGPAGQLLDPRLVAAIASDDIVGVVLNSIGDSLDHGERGALADWSVSRVKYLTELLNSARGQGRPVVLVSDHGHVLDRAEAEVEPAAAEGVESARWRTGTEVGEGEVSLSGPRVLENDGRVTVPWSEEIRYTPRKAGYYGGASLAEMTVPVLVLAPSAELAPAEWSELPRESVQPSWWEAETPSAPAQTPVKPAKRAVRTKQKPQPQEAELFAVDAVEVPAAASSLEPDEPTLGRQILDTTVYKHQRKFVRKAPEHKVVAAVIDALDQAGGTLSLAAVAAAAIGSGGRTNTRPEGLVTVLTRLLNIEGYEVISLIDSRTRVRLNRETLREQFELSEEIA